MLASFHSEDKRNDLSLGLCGPTWYDAHPILRPRPAPDTQAHLEFHNPIMLPPSTGLAGLSAAYSPCGFECQFSHHHTGWVLGHCVPLLQSAFHIRNFALICVITGLVAVSLTEMKAPQGHLCVLTTVTPVKNPPPPAKQRLNKHLLVD